MATTTRHEACKVYQDHRFHDVQPAMDTAPPRGTSLPCIHPAVGWADLGRTLLLCEYHPLSHLHICRHNFNLY